MANADWAKFNKNVPTEVFFPFDDGTQMKNGKWKFGCKIDGEDRTLSAGPLLRDLLFWGLNCTQPEDKTVTNAAGQTFTFPAVAYSKGKTLWLTEGEPSPGDKGYMNPHFTVTRPGGEFKASFEGATPAPGASGQPPQAADAPRASEAPQRQAAPTNTVPTITAREYFSRILSDFDECYAAAVRFCETRNVAVQSGGDLLRLAQHFSTGLRYKGLLLEDKEAEAKAAAEAKDREDAAEAARIEAEAAAAAEAAATNTPPSPTPPPDDDLPF